MSDPHVASANGRHDAAALRARRGATGHGLSRLISACKELWPQARSEAPSAAAGAPIVDWKRSVLPSEGFGLLLDRERSLADRGTRVFTLVELRRTSGPAGALGQLGQQLRQRLRSTDVVGWLDAERLGVLLCDTGAEAAGFLAEAVEDGRRRQGLELSATVFVYPSPEQSGEQSGGGTQRGNGRGPDEPPGAGSSGGTVRPLGAGRRSAGEDGHAHDVGARPRSHVACAGARWPVRDLWSLFVQPLPWWKRAMDVLVGGACLIVLAPLFALVAVAILLDSPGPVIFRQMRAG
ncbi:MAG TPA: sugar transferase, partial [Planctomycetota bacterium]|nr:sugar transferase [Planctomycetota bacterium]